MLFKFIALQIEVDLLAIAATFQKNLGLQDEVNYTVNNHFISLETRH